MRIVSCSIWFVFHLASAYRVAGLSEHKVHNIVLYPDKHSWCKKTEIKQIVAHPGCSFIEIDNNVCVGACFSYSIPRTIPSSPGEVITPYCDSCQPVDYEWREVALTCSDESEEDEGQTEMTKRVQVITNCSCTSCEKQYEEKNVSYHQKHVGSKSSDDVPELMSLMMGVHRNTRPQGPESEEEEEAAEDVQMEQRVSVPDGDVENAIKSDEKENLIEEHEDGHGKPDKESRTLEILHVKDKMNSSKRMSELIEIAKSDHKHYEFGPRHSLVMRPDEPVPGTRVHHLKLGEDESGEKDEDFGKKGRAKDYDEEDEEGSLAVNQFKIHDNEKYPDQIAVESVRKEVKEPKIMSVPHMIYNASLKEGKWKNEATMLEMSHHHLQPAVEGIEFSYYGKRETKSEKGDDEKRI